ncbi:MAG: NifB/NifX family molybdenum-iron cluster-binding protein [Bacteroidota bacterium]
MKIAIPTNDKKNIFEHTGRASFFAVTSVEDLNIVEIDYRENPPHQHDEETGHSHSQLVRLISDCDLVLVKNIGKHFMEELEKAGIAFEKTTADTIGGAVSKYLSDYQK